MSGLVSDTIGGYNAFIDKQKQEPGEALLTTILFDDKYEVLHDGVNLKDIKPLSDKEYFPRGATALLDAVGKTINTVGARLNSTREEDRPSKVIFVITTDGYENSSKEFVQAKVKEMIEHQTTKYNWQFLFLGANIDAVSTAKTYGIRSDFAANYTANSAGTDSLYCTVSQTVANYRNLGAIDQNWKDEIE
jgi:hypothetical protein